MAALTKEKKQQIAMVAFAGAGALVAIWFFGIKPLQSKFANLQNKIGETQKREQEAKRLVAQAPQRQAELEEAQRKLAEIEDKMVSGDTNVWIRTLIIGFKSTGHYSGVDIPNYSTSDEVKVGILPDFPYKSCLYRISGLAYYHDLGRFLAGFENAFPHIRIQNIELTPVDSTQPASPEKLNFALEIVALIKPPPDKR
ncbi:MAG: hypothetical protein HY300_06845 [Verrucomicrobia bacterium]|nr:hypothetical protein [Verrucomicrobiota bacterium]